MRNLQTLFYSIILSTTILISLTSGLSANTKLSSLERGLVYHSVFFRYKKNVAMDSKKLNEIRTRFLELKTKSLKNGLPYIVSIVAGNANSAEGVDQKMTDGYILTFKNIKDRDYYVGCDHKIKCAKGGYKKAGISYDHAHDKFKSFIGPLLYDANGDGIPVPEGVFVFDFVSS